MVDVRFGGLSHLTFQASYYIGLKIQNAGFGKPLRFLYTYACIIIICYMGLEMSIRLNHLCQRIQMRIICNSMQDAE